jgi:hypothetical protein
MLLSLACQSEYFIGYKYIKIKGPIEMSITVHPIFTEEIKLPFVVYGIGTQEEQCSIHRPKGFPMDQLIFSKKGSGILQNIHGTYEINQGEYAYLKPHEPHSYRSMGALGPPTGYCLKETIPPRLWNP